MCTTNTFAHSRGNGTCRISLNCTIPVSYTHLDVYKRQIAEFSRPSVFGEDRLRERGSLPATFNVLTTVIFSMSNDNCRTFKQNQIFFWIIPELLSTQGLFILVKIG